jgi:hypothetical protein
MDRVTRAGETLHVTFSDADGCAFDAFQGRPGRLSRCGAVGMPDDGRERASIARLALDLLSNSAAEAATLHDARDGLLRPGG